MGARLLALLLLFALGCDEPETPAAPPIEPDPSPAPAPTPPPPAPLEDPAPPPVTFEVPADPAALPEVPTVERGRRITSRGGGWQVPAISNEVARGRLARILEDAGYARSATESHWVEEEGGGYWDSDIPDYGGCRTVLATDRVISMLCYGVDVHRGGGASNTFQGKVHVAIRGEEAVPFTIEDALAPGSSLAEVLTEERCTEDLVAQGRPRMESIRLCRPAVATPEQWVLGATGFAHPYQLGSQPEPPTFSVRYAAVAEHLRRDGPVAWIFAGPKPPDWVSEEDARGHSVSPVLPWSDLGVLAARLSDEDLARVGVEAYDDLAGRLVVGDAASLEAARSIAGQLETEVHRARWSGALRPVRRAHSAHNLILGPRSVPQGLHVLAIGAPDEGRTVAVGGPALHGMVASAALVADDGCRPDPTAFLAAIDEPRRAEARERLHVASIDVRTEPGAETRRAALLAMVVGRETWVSVAPMDDACHLDAPMLEETLSGRLFDLRIGTTEPEGAGETFVVVGLYRGERLRAWHAYRLADGRRIFEETLGPQNLFGNEQDVIPLVGLDGTNMQEWAPLSFLGRPYRWTGRRLVEE